MRDVALDPDCVDFHMKVGTDFQRWITKGVGYFDTFMIEKLELQFFKDKQTNQNKKMRPIDRPDDIEKFKKFAKSYAEWVEGDQKHFEISERNSFMRMHYYAHIRQTTPTFSHETIPIDKWNKTIKVTRLTEEEKEDFDTKQKVLTQQEFDRLLAFSRVWKHIKEAQKPLVGHNCFMDLMFTFDHFERRNPRSFSQFKEVVKAAFPKIYDTKLIAIDQIIADADSKVSGAYNLENLYTLLSTKANVKVDIPQDEGFTNFNDKNIEFFHDAGYDAFVTGSSFCFMMGLFGDTLAERNENVIRLHGNQLFHCSFRDIDKDEIYYKAGFLAVLIDKVAQERSKVLDVLRYINNFSGNTSDAKLTIVNSPNVKQNEPYYHILVTFDKRHVDKKFEWM